MPSPAADLAAAMLSSGTRNTDPAVQTDLSRPGDGPAGGQVARGEEVVEPKGPHQTGRWTPDIPALDQHPEREVRDEEHADPGFVPPATGRSPEVHEVLLPAGPDVERESRSGARRLDEPAGLGGASDGLTVDGPDQVTGVELPIGRAPG